MVGAGVCAVRGYIADFSRGGLIAWCMVRLRCLVRSSWWTGMQNVMSLGGIGVRSLDHRAELGWVGRGGREVVLR